MPKYFERLTVEHSKDCWEKVGPKELKMYDIFRAICGGQVVEAEGSNCFQVVPITKMESIIRHFEGFEARTFSWVPIFNLTAARARLDPVE